MRSRAEGASTRAVVLTAALAALAATLGYMEAVLLPPMPVPGVRVGLANVAVVVALATLGPRSALSVGVVRVLAVGLVTGTLAGPASIMALGGTLASLAVMIPLARAGGDFSAVGLSVAGAAAHVSAQSAVAALLVGSAAPLLLVPFALGLSLAAGLVTGSLASTLITRAPHLLSRPLSSERSGTEEEACVGAASAGGM